MLCVIDGRCSWFVVATYCALRLFCLVILAIDINHINKLLDRVKEMNDNSHLRNIKIAFQEFEAFAKLGKQLEFFSLAIFSYGKISGELTKSNFQRAASQVYGITIIDAVADIIFHVFDANRDGNLNADEFIKIIQRRESSVALEDIEFVILLLELCNKAFIN
ncbi:hypothetical protein HN51_050086 [Arachis hypogaea]|uniref:calcium uptake protein, mitochondrial-like n=1 Tax=Arachis ipaensis TaxID=130454 RepID=UPI000A2B0CE8|nr:calcium uptake protein, mitochondrial-like [Arachis ipaensis]XP_020962988.1 calcium uptake protein, mitochondrial-like [Arachis ipaensis]XP_025667584.1 calcium uptake protein, mitochondrial-like [Arachis hypogaea]QHN91738.1 Calcium-binding EF-hand [Arachis hypogaea]